MFTHTDIWQAIDRLADAFGYSASGLAKKAGLDPTTFNKSKRTSADGKPRWPSTESISKILAVTGATMSEFINLGAAEQPASKRTIPLLGLAQAGCDGYFDDAGYPVGTGWDEIRFPDNNGTERDQPHYAIEVSGESMQPLYRNGDILVVAPGATLRRGDRVVVRTKAGEVMVKELTRQSASRIELTSLNPDHDGRAFRLDEISWIARVVWVSQ